MAKAPFRQEDYDDHARQLGEHIWGFILIIMLTLFMLAVVSYAVRLDGEAAVALALTIVASAVAFYVYLRAEYRRGYDLFQKGVHFEIKWSHARKIGWADAMMDREDLLDESR